jgi:hypothetical protein
VPGIILDAGDKVVKQTDKNPYFHGINNLMVIKENNRAGKGVGDC